MNEIEVNSKPRRAQGGKGLLSQSIQVQELKNPWLKTQVLESRGREPRGREGRQGKRSVLGLGCFWRRKERREDEGYLRCPRRGPKYPRLKLDTKTPVGAKSEICTRSHPTAEFLSSTRSLSRDAAMSMKIRFAVLGGSAKPG